MYESLEAARSVIQEGLFNTFAGMLVFFGLYAGAKSFCLEDSENAANEDWN